ncbi:MAG: acetylglutamate kinase [Flavobacteriaceae bacterium]|nr:MAG: acetylglutamate kinase [Flavobacteriaceae bacterium]
MKQKLSIIKIGGNIIEDQESLSQFLELFAQLEGPKILIHGGGKRATEFGRRLGIESKMVEGRRITDAKSLELVVMVYAGLVNKNIVAQLQANNSNAIGLSGADANTVIAVKRPVNKLDFGFVGDIVNVNAGSISKLLTADFVPVFCALTHDRNGQLLNTNADTIASELAIAMSQAYDTTLYYCFEKKGVLRSIKDEDSVIQKIDLKSYENLKQKKIVADGMLPKLDNCFHALNKDVQQVCIGDISMFKPEAQFFTTITL